jgi:predicted nucleic acid-binding protein
MVCLDTSVLVALIRKDQAAIDLIIASNALQQEEKLVTRNVKHFSRVPGLLTEQW